MLFDNRILRKENTVEMAGGDKNNSGCLTHCKVARLSSTLLVDVLRFNIVQITIVGTNAR